MNNRISPSERRYLARIKEQRCSVCEAPGPSEAHHIKQGEQYLCIPLCKDCHTGSFNGLHGQKRMWSLKKMDELDALAVTLRRMLAN
jgi:hypothetical protein